MDHLGRAVKNSDSSRVARNSVRFGQRSNGWMKAFLCVAFALDTVGQAGDVACLKDLISTQLMSGVSGETE